MITNEPPMRVLTNGANIHMMSRDKIWLFIDGRERYLVRAFKKQKLQMNKTLIEEWD